ncbi:FAD-binding protein [Adlercreutzia equolifaciens]|uniref:FAD-dependent oxidoreductase n=1 Tax=Adlercreutzia equolifaciens TaxID=446660 RepID=UPI0026DABAC7|nr:FAD-binding protein [Adlercreutzia equolifaciens]
MFDEKITLSRRGFLGTGAAALGGLGIAALSGCAPKTLSDTGAADEGAAEADAAAADWLGEAPVIAEDDIVETVDVDVLCVGASNGGLVAAARLAELGSRVMVAEVLQVPGTFRTSIAAIDSRLQKSMDIHVSKAHFARELQRYMTGQADGRVIRAWADQSGAAMDWLLDLFEEYGIDYYMETDHGSEDMAYEEWIITHRINDAAGAMEALVDRAQKNGADIRYETKMVKLETDDSGAVVGAICEDLANGGYIRVKTGKGVVLATGGFATNDDMLRALCPDAFNSCVSKEMTPTQNGDGIKAALWVGGAMDPDGLCQIFDRACVPFGEEYDGPGDDGVMWWPGSQPFLRTTLRGERFSNESTPYDFGIYAIRQQHANTWVQVFDSTWQDQIAQFRTVGCSRIVDPSTMPGWQPIIPMEAIMGMFQGYLDAGIVKQADSIEELAAEMGADPAVLTATVNRYNELCEAGEDVDFYKESSRMLPVGQPPFYAVRLGGMLMCTCNGLTIDDDMRVLNANGDAIKGLYATGNDSGGMFARHYPSRMSGLTMGRAVTFSHHIAEVISA